jgi:hypothetical protein
MTTKFDLPIDSFVASSSGPVMCEDLAPGMELVMVGRDGRFGTSAVRAVEEAGEVEVGKLLTSVGDIKVSLSGTIVTKLGFQRVRDLMGTTKGSTRIELVSPADLPRQPGRRPLRKSDIVSALHSFETPVIMVPAIRSDLEELVDSIEGYLNAAGGEYEVAETDRWVTFVFVSDAPSRPSDLRAESEVLSTLTAWTNEDGTMRTRVSDNRVRRRLIAGLVAKGVAPAVQWVPAYRPAECHLSKQAQWKPFTSLHSVQIEHESIVRVDVSGSGRLVCGLAIIGSGA